MWRTRSTEMNSPLDGTCQCLWEKTRKEMSASMSNALIGYILGMPAIQQETKFSIEFGGTERGGERRGSKRSTLRDCFDVEMGTADVLQLFDS